MTTIKIFQLDNVDFSKKLIEFMMATEISINADDYELMYEYKDENPENKSDMETLNHVWRKFNDDERPDGHRMRSLSISDVVQVEGRSYICNTFGWKDIQFVGNEMIKIK